MTDFGPLIANPRTLLLGGGAQFGVFATMFCAVAFGGFTLGEAASIGIIGGADGPTSIFTANKLAKHLIGPIAVAAYTYMALVPLIQPPIMRLMTNDKERKIRMKALRQVSKAERIVFAVMVMIVCILVVPDASALIIMLMLGNIFKEAGVVEPRLYLGGFEIWRKVVNGVLDTERETLHVMDDKRRIALVETLTVENGNLVANPAPVQRYQLDNHLGSASLELDDSANIISYEEYYPYGDTSYRAGRTASEVRQKRYRYTGKEKDEESGLYYHGARYYACWLGRWTAADPIGIGDGMNVYMYVRGNPVKLQDPSGTQTVEND